MAAETRVTIDCDLDVVAARRSGRIMATEIGFGAADTTLIATAISELARNIVQYAKRGEMVFRSEARLDRLGMVIVASDQGPGIPDLDRAMQDGFSSGKGLGLGLPGAKRMVDEFAISSEVGKGTTITLTKWLPRRR